MMNVDLIESSRKLFGHVCVKTLTNIKKKRPISALTGIQIEDLHNTKLEGWWTDV